MKLIEPKVELLSEVGISQESHIARCARVCYGKEYKEPNQEIDEKMVDGLIKRQHLSMLRHASMYFYHLECTARHTQAHIANSPYWNYSMSLKYASTNLQEFMRSKEYREPATVINNSKFLDECSKHPELFELYRMTFCITTQISTSRELNRCSPNAIAERSTRYCSSKDGLEICRPWWYDEDTLARDMYKANMKYLETAYKYLLGAGMKPEDARGILPLDTATKVIYTYSIREWQHILDLRLYDKTGKAHPNVHIVMQMVKDQINQFTKEHNIDFQV
ncbi:MAG: FAD-dependent thymidylate synthase [Prevotella sp.]|nr:FAD-dependent thymidylate synthase [Prevotella sp.]